MKNCYCKATLFITTHAENLGVDALLCLPDLFFKPTTVDDLVDYLKHVGNVAPKTSLFYYHFPAYTGVTLSMAEFMGKAKDEIPSLGGIKFTSNNLQEGAECANIYKDELKVFLGNEQTLAGAFVLGFDSSTIIGVNLAPDLVFKIWDSIQKNSNKEALEYQNKFSNIIARITKDGFFPGTKAAMSYITGLEMGSPRPPQKTFDAEQLKRLKQELKDLNLLSS